MHRVGSPEGHDDAWKPRAGARERHAVALRAALFAVALVAPGCAGFWRWPWGTTQRWPGPMEATVDPLPPGDSQLYPPGPEDVLVVRHADPVQVRPAGLPSSFPLSFYNKSLRVSSGSAVYAAPGGRVEVIWPNATSVVLFGRGSGIIGSKSRGEPTFIIRQVERAEVMFKKEDQIELLGGSQLSAHSGPFMLDHFRENILRVRNQSKSAGQIAYREANFVLDPGQVIDLPLLSVGSKPRRLESGLGTLNGAGFRVDYSGQVEVLSKDADVAVRSLGEDTIHAMGVRVSAARDEEVRFGGLTKKPVLTPPVNPVVAPSPSAAPKSAPATPAAAQPAAPTPGNAQPDNTKNESAKPDGAKPDAAKNDSSKPDHPQTDNPKPEASKPDASKPNGPSPEGSKPDSTKPDSTKPDGSKPDGSKPDGSKPDGSKPDGSSRDDRMMRSTASHTAMSELSCAIAYTVSLCPWSEHVC